MPGDFIPFAQRQKTVLSASNGNSNKANEMIYTNKKTYESFSDEQKRDIEMRFAKQITLFEMGA
jgi:hypothetical protein